MSDMQHSTPLVDGHEYQEVKRCPKCTSVFVTDLECEACGFQLNYSPLGEAFGEKSFYSLKESYWDSRSKIVRIYPSLERKKSEEALKYKRKLIHRYDEVLTFLLGESEEERGFYWLELQGLCRELISYEFPLFELEARLNDHSFHGYAPLIHDFLSSLSLEKNEEKTLWDKLLDYELGGVLKIRFLLATAIVLAALSTASLLVYQYFFLFT